MRDLVKSAQIIAVGRDHQPRDRSGFRADKGRRRGARRCGQHHADHAAMHHRRNGLIAVACGNAMQYYPFPALSLIKELERFKGAEMLWCQEEPKNQGAWSFIEPNIEWALTRIDATHTRPRYVGRSASASPATGLASQHKAQQEALVNAALTIEGK